MFKVKLVIGFKLISCAILKALLILSYIDNFFSYTGLLSARIKASNETFKFFSPCPKLLCIYLKDDVDRKTS